MTTPAGPRAEYPHRVGVAAKPVNMASLLRMIEQTIDKAA